MRRCQEEMLPFSFGYDDGPAIAWDMPTSLPDYSGASVISLDIETYDPGLIEKGPGHVFNNGHIEGVSLALDETTYGYYPVTTEKHGGFSVDQIIEWLNRIFGRDTTMVGHSLLYDYGWLNHYGFKHTGKFFDVQFAEALIDEHRKHYSLDAIAHDYGLAGKKTVELYEWCNYAFGGGVGPKQRANIYRAPLYLVGPYAEADAYVPMQVKAFQEPIIDEEGLRAVLDMENALIPMLTAMRKRGVRVDEKSRDTLDSQLTSELVKACSVIEEYAGHTINADSPDEIAKVFDKQGWSYPYTAKTKKPSFTKAFLQSVDEPFVKSILTCRSLSKMQSTFVRGYFNKAYKGRLHCNIHPLRTDDNGTVSGRFSTTAPNLGNIPSRDPTWAPLIRGLFLPDEGEEWVSLDIKQAEFRFLAHYGMGDGASALRAKYCRDPTTDFHAAVQKGTGIGRKPIKTLVFSMCIAEGELVLTDRGLVPIEKIWNDDLLWDGYEWVPHDGLLYKGISDVITYGGLTATRDHEVWSEYGTKMRFGDCANGNIFLMTTGDGLKAKRVGMSQVCSPVMGGKSQRARVYDILNAGPRHRFTVSNVLVSNCYGSGVANTASLLGVSKDKAIEFREAFFSANPFIKTTFDTCMRTALNRGYLKTIMGRRSRFTEWEPSDFDLARALGTFGTREEVQKIMSGTPGLRGRTHIQRAHCHKALNAIMQGGVADYLKISMLKMWNSGVFDTVGVPLLTVYDELDFSKPCNAAGDEAIEEIKNIMSHAIKLRVPVGIDDERGSNWGNIK